MGMPPEVASNLEGAYSDSLALLHQLVNDQLTELRKLVDDDTPEHSDSFQLRDSEDAAAVSAPPGLDAPLGAPENDTNEGAGDPSTLQRAGVMPPPLVVDRTPPRAGLRFRNAVIEEASSEGRRHETFQPVQSSEVPADTSRVRVVNQARAKSRGRFWSRECGE